MKTYKYKGFEFYKGRNSYFVGNKEDGQIAPNDNVSPQTIAECKAVINSWLKVPEKKTEIIFWSELTEEQKELFIENNREYLVWNDGSYITKNQLDNFMLVYNEDLDVWSLTMKNEDFYIYDVIF